MNLTKQVLKIGRDRYYWRGSRQGIGFDKHPRTTFFSDTRPSPLVISKITTPERTNVAPAFIPSLPNNLPTVFMDYFLLRIVIFFC